MERVDGRTREWLADEPQLRAQIDAGARKGRGVAPRRRGVDATGPQAAKILSGGDSRAGINDSGRRGDRGPAPDASRSHASRGQPRGVRMVGRPLPRERVRRAAARCARDVRVRGHRNADAGTRRRPRIARVLARGRAEDKGRGSVDAGVRRRVIARADRRARTRSRRSSSSRTLGVACARRARDPVGRQPRSEPTVGGTGAGPAQRARGQDRGRTSPGAAHRGDAVSRGRARSGARRWRSVHRARPGHAVRRARGPARRVPRTAARARRAARRDHGDDHADPRVAAVGQLPPGTCATRPPRRPGTTGARRFEDELTRSRAHGAALRGGRRGGGVAATADADDLMLARSSRTGGRPRDGMGDAEAACHDPPAARTRSAAGRRRAGRAMTSWSCARRARAEYRALAVSRARGRGCAPALTGEAAGSKTRSEALRTRAADTGASAIPRALARRAPDGGAAAR